MIQVTNQFKSLLKSARNESLRLLDVEYMNRINQLLQQKTIICKQIHQQYDELFTSIDNITNNQFKQIAVPPSQPTLITSHSNDLQVTKPITKPVQTTYAKHKQEHCGEWHKPCSPYCTKKTCYCGACGGGCRYTGMKGHWTCCLNEEYGSECTKKSKTRFTKRKQSASTKVYKCKICNKTYATKGGLTVHNREHTGYYKFKCPYCDEGFYQQGSLTQHTLKTHKQLPFPCHICKQVAFKLQRELKAHKLQCYGPKPFVFTNKKGNMPALESLVDNNNKRRTDDKDNNKKECKREY